MALFGRYQLAGASCPKVFNLRGLPKPPKRTAPRGQLHLRPAHHSQMSKTSIFSRFGPSLLNTWTISLSLGPVWQCQDQEEQECPCGPALEQAPHGAATAHPFGLCSAGPVGETSRSEEQMHICLASVALRQHLAAQCPGRHQPSQKVGSGPQQALSSTRQRVPAVGSFLKGCFWHKGNGDGNSSGLNCSK